MRTRATLAAGILVALLAACGSRPTTAPAATPTDVPTPVPMPIPTDAPEPTEAPTTAPEPAPTDAPLPTVAGAAPQGSDCPADHPVKGNIVDRGDNKGDKIYHVPGGSSYAATKPERCFLDAAEAEAAGFRAPN